MKSHLNQHILDDKHITFDSTRTSTRSNEKPTIRLVADNSSGIRAQSYQLSIETSLLTFHHFIENFNAQTLLLKMNGDERGATTDQCDRTRTTLLRHLR
jgi:hypothetical protein